MLKNIVSYTPAFLVLASANGIGPKKNINLLSQIQKRELSGKPLKPKQITIQDQDFSNQNFRNQNFNDCIFENVSFKDADLTGAQFERSKFINVDLEGAIFYYPLDDSGQPILEKALKLKKFENKAVLFYYYSFLIQSGKSKEDEGLTKDAEMYFEAAKCLNKLFAPLSNNFRDLKFDHSIAISTKLDLTGTDLENFNFEGILLSNVILERANLRGTNFEKAHFIDVSFDKADLREANLTGAQFIFSTLKNTDLRNSKLKDIRFFDHHSSIKDAPLKPLLATLSYSYLQSFYAEIKNKKFDTHNIGRVRLSNQITLPEIYKNEDLLDIYHFCLDTNTKIILEQILKAKKILSDNHYDKGNSILR